MWQRCWAEILTRAPLPPRSISIKGALQPRGSPGCSNGEHAVCCDLVVTQSWGAPNLGSEPASCLCDLEPLAPSLITAIQSLSQA